MVCPRTHVSAASGPSGGTKAATSAIAYHTRYPPPDRRLRHIAWSRSFDVAGSIVTNGIAPRSSDGSAVDRAISSASLSAAGGNAAGSRNSSRSTEKSMRGAHTRLIGTAHSYQPFRPPHTRRRGHAVVWRDPFVRARAGQRLVATLRVGAGFRAATVRPPLLAAVALRAAAGD